jgi:sortase B
MLYFIDKMINKFIMTIIIIIILLSVYCFYDLFPIRYEIKKSEEYKNYNPNLHNEYDNKNIIGWIKIYNTIIDYPILQSDNNTDYLSLNYKNEYSNAGSIFLDYRNNKYFKDDFNIIYGHNMSYKAMFAELKYYINKEYFDTHNKGIILLKDESYNINIILYKEINANDDIPYNLYLYKNKRNKKIYKYFMNEYGNEKKLLVLSTCKNGSRNKRIILLAVLKKI